MRRQLDTERYDIVRGVIAAMDCGHSRTAPSLTGYIPEREEECREAADNFFNNIVGWPVGSNIGVVGRLDSSSEMMPRPPHVSEPTPPSLPSLPSEPTPPSLPPSSNLSSWFTPSLSMLQMPEKTSAHEHARAVRSWRVHTLSMEDYQQVMDEAAQEFVAPGPVAQPHCESEPEPEPEPEPELEDSSIEEIEAQVACAKARIEHLKVEKVRATAARLSQLQQQLEEMKSEEQTLRRQLADQ